MFEPACGIGHISNVFKGYNYEVIEQDLYVPHNIDYLASEDPEYSFLITNPPYALKYQFLKKAFESNKPFAMLLPATCFFTVIGLKMFDQTGWLYLLFAGQLILYITRNQQHLQTWLGSWGTFSPSLTKESSLLT